MVRGKIAAIGALLVMAALTGGCAGLRDRSGAPCFDGWSDGVSRLWRPPAEELTRIVAALGDRGQIACIHRMPSGQLIVLSGKNRQVLSTDMVARDGAYVVTETGWVI